MEWNWTAKHENAEWQKIFLPQLYEPQLICHSLRAINVSTRRDNKTLKKYCKQSTSMQRGKHGLRGALWISTTDSDCLRKEAAGELSAPRTALLLLHWIPLTVTGQTQCVRCSAGWAAGLRPIAYMRKEIKAGKIIWITLRNVAMTKATEPLWLPQSMCNS